MDAGRRGRLWVALALGLFAVAAIAGTPPRQGPPLDPRSSSGDGTKALVLLLQRFGARVDLVGGLPGPGTSTALLLRDRLDDARRTALMTWIGHGGTLVLADPGSALQPSAPVRVGGDVLESPGTLDGPCPDASLGDVARIDAGPARFLRLPAGGRGCFPAPDRRDAYELVVSAVGRGRIVALGGAGVFTNSLLGHDDNSVLAVDLLMAAGTGSVAVLLPSTAGGGQRSLNALLPRRVKLALAQLVVAFVVVALWRGRRLGRPVRETQPVQLAGSELVVAVGNLLARTGRRDAAASALRGDLRRWLSSRAGVAPTAPAAVMAAAVASRTGVDAHRLSRLLDDQPLASDADLVAVAAELDRIREEVMRGRSS